MKATLIVHQRYNLPVYGPLESTVFDALPTERRRPDRSPDPLTPPIDRIEPERRSWIARLVIFAIVTPLIVAAFIAGLELRDWIWKQTAPIRFQDDVANGYRWGTRVVSEARILATAERHASPNEPITWREF